MITVRVPMIYDELLEFLAKHAPPETILAFEASEESNERAAYLMEKSYAGTMTREEAIELDQMCYFEGRLSVLKARAANRIKQRR